ncbi:MAG: master DNA invertase Mpi family serine-type recombinase [Paludibacteraceae bacterium]|nr:master DNA invertase Mpi family serine-type recombinase [Paludibacteraceae bacterium]
MIYGYIRVSSDKQTVENQRFEIEEFCRVNNLIINGWIEETISGAKEYNKRRLGLLLRKTRAGDTIVCSELSRLGRSLFMIMEILSLCMRKECRVWTIKEGYRLGDDIQSKVLAFAFGLSAEIERKLISQRTKEALARVRAEGKKLGRPFGYRYTRRQHRCYEKEALIRRMMAQGVSQRRIAMTIHVSRNTLRIYCAKFMWPKE